MKLIKDILITTCIFAASTSIANAATDVSKIKHIRKVLSSGSDSSVNVINSMDMKNQLEINSDLTIKSIEKDKYSNAFSARKKLKEVGVKVVDSTLTLESVVFNNFKHGALATAADAVIKTKKASFIDNKTNGNGAAIYNESTSTDDKSMIIDSVFIGNTAAENGGALHNALGTMEFNDVLFRGNTATNGVGGAINNDSKSNTRIFWSLLDDNKAKGDGGAINSKGKLLVHSTTLNNNISEEGRGGAINNTGLLTVEESTFKRNESKGNGGAINHVSNTSSDVLTVRDTIFKDNISKEGNGGAIAAEGTSYVFDSVFKGNEGQNGGAIYNRRGYIETKSSNFVNNVARTGGGAIYSSNISRLNVEDGRFVGNTAVNAGGAILNYGQADNIDGRFIRNSVTSEGSAYGGAIATSGDMAKVGYVGGVFKNNHVETNTGYANGGAIANYANEAVIAELNAKFANNYAKSNSAYAARGGAIYNIAEISDLTGVFTNNYTQSEGLSQGGAIYNGNSLYYKTAGVINITDSIFRDNGRKSSNGKIMTKQGGAIYNAEGGYVSMDNTRFVGNASTLAGGAFYNEAGDFDINNSVFKKNVTKGDGGAIYNAGTELETMPMIRGTVFSKNKATNDGGAIFNAAGSIEIQNSLFRKNKAKNGDGGAIHNEKGAEVRLFGSTFNGNKAQGNGGAIDNAGKLVVSSLGNGETYSVFKNNIAKTGSGGAIHNTGGLYVQQAIFKNNTAALNGGAINNYFTSGLTMRDSLFEGNVATTGNGGAFYNASTSSHILGSTFTGNEATEGGAIYNRNGSLNISASDISDNAAVFTDNHARTLGGAIYSSNISRLNIEDALFARNTAVSGGGAIYNVGSANNIIGEFTENSAVGYGGAIYNRGNLAIVDYIGGTFNGNFVQNDTGYYAFGGAIANLADDAVIKEINANFVNNYASSSGTTTVKGGAIMNQAEISELSGAFVHNYTESNGISQGGAIYNEKSHVYIPTEGYLKVVDSAFYKNGIRESDDMVMTKQGGAIYNSNSGSVLEVEGSYFLGNAATLGGGAVYNAGTATIVDSYFVGNKATNGLGGAISNEGDLTIKALNGYVGFLGNKDSQGESNAFHNLASGVINLLAAEDKVISIGDKITGNGDLNIGTISSTDNVNYDGWVVINSDTSGYTGAVTLNSGTLRLAGLLSGDTNVFSDFTVNGGTLDTVNLFTNKIDASNWNVVGQLNAAIDVNLVTKEADYFSGVGNKDIAISNISVIEVPYFGVRSADIAVADAGNSMSLASSGERAYGLVHAYDVTDNKLQSEGKLTFNKNGFNPTALKTSSALSGHLVNIADAIKNVIAPSSRVALNLASGEQSTSPFVSAWLETYYASDDINLGGSEIDSDSYFTIIGGDIKGSNLGSWTSLYSVYTGYMGSHQTQSNYRIDQDGMIFGGSLTLEKDNLYSIVTSNVSTSFANSKTSTGDDDFNIYSFSIANKSGAKYDVIDSLLTLEPSLSVGYHYIHTEDYRASNGVMVESDGLSIFNVLPELKFALNLEGPVKPYVAAGYNWNIDAGGDVTANGILLPTLSVDKYAEFRLGVEFELNEIEGFVEGQASSGDRDGFGVQLGVKWNF